MITPSGKVIGNVAYPDTSAAIESNLGHARRRGDSSKVAHLERELRIMKFLEEGRPILSELNGELGKLGKLGALAEIRSEISKLQKVFSQARAQIARRDALLKTAKVQREVNSLREALRKAQSFRSSGNLSKLDWRHRWEFDQAERVCIRRLATIEAERKVNFRSSSRSDARKHRQAMVERGVTFDRMMAGS